MTYNSEDLIACQKHHAFVLLTYRTAPRFPGDERFGLTSQFRHATVFIEANISTDYFNNLYVAPEEAIRCLTACCNAIVKNKGVYDTIF